MVLQKDFKNHEYRLYYTLINRESLELEGEFVNIGLASTLKHKNPYDARSKFTRSKNGKFLLVVAMDDAELINGSYSPTGSRIGDLKTGKITFSFWVFNQDLNIVNKTTNYWVENTNSHLALKENLCDDSGNVVISIYDKILDKGKFVDMFKKDPLYIPTELTYRVIYFKNDQSYEFKTSNKEYISEMKVSFSPNGKTIDLVGGH